MGLPLQPSPPSGQRQGLLGRWKLWQALQSSWKQQRSSNTHSPRGHPVTLPKSHVHFALEKGKIMPEAFYFKPCEIRKREDAKMKWRKKKVWIHFRSCNGLEAKLVHFEGVEKENLIHSPVGTGYEMLKVKYVNMENYLLKTISFCAWKNFFFWSICTSILH